MNESDNRRDQPQSDGRDSLESAREGLESDRRDELESKRDGPEPAQDELESEEAARPKLGNAWRQLVALTQKEIRQTLRDRRMVVLLIGPPIIQLLVFGSAVDFDVDRVPTAVVDHDSTPASREFLQRLFADGTLTRSATYGSDQEAAAALIGGRAGAAVLVGEDFSRLASRSSTNEPAMVQVIVDGTNPNISSAAANAAARFAQRAARERLEQRLASLGDAAPRIPDAAEVRARILFNPQLETAVYMVPGIIAMVLLVITTIVSSMGLARERENGTLEQVLVTPIRPWVLIAGKTLPFAMIGLFDFMLAIVVAAYVFEVPIRGSVALLLLATLLYLTACLSLGLLISTLSRTQQQAFMGGFLLMLPAALLSGIMTPIHAMPDWLEPWTLFNPLRHYASVMRAVMLRGAGLDSTWPELAALFAIALVIAVIATRRFRKTLV